MKCPNCGMNISENARMCVHCGTSIQPFANQVVQSTQPFANQVVQSTQPVQNNMVQGTNLQQVPQVVDNNKPKGIPIGKIIFITLLVIGICLAIFFYIKKLETDAKVNEEFEEDAETYFQAVSIAADANVFESEGKTLSSGEFYYVLIDNDIQDKEHPFTPKDDKEKKEKEYFDEKGYIIIVKGYTSSDTQGFVCFNNGKDEKRFISIKTMDFNDIVADNSNNSFGNLKIDKKGPCDINELLGRSNYPLYQLTKKEDK